MTHRLIVIKHTPHDWPYNKHSKLWENFRSHCITLSPDGSMVVHAIHLHKMLKEYHAFIGVDPVSQDTYLEFTDSESMMQFELSWS